MQHFSSQIEDESAKNVFSLAFSVFKASARYLYVPKPFVQETMFFPNKLNERRLAKVLKRARNTLDVAVFAFTNNKLSKAILHCWNRGVKCRAITDDECSKFTGADIYQLAAAGIPCTMDDHARYHMHNKFALIDSEVLVTGKQACNR